MSFLKNFLKKTNSYTARSPRHTHSLLCLVPSVIREFDMSQVIDNDKLLHTIYNYKEQHPISRDTSPWHSGWLTHFKTTAFDELTEQVLVCLNSALHPLYEYQVSELWFNVYLPGEDYAERHNHPVSYAAVYFAKCDKNSSPLIFDNNMKEGTEEITITPEVGKLVIFPSHVFHRVPKNPNNNERITIAMNIIRGTKRLNDKDIEVVHKGNKSK